MIKPILLVVASLLLGVRPAGADTSTGPLLITPTADWKMVYKKDENGEGYTLTPPPPQTSLFMISRWPAAGNAEDIPRFLDKMGHKFAETAARNPKIKLASPNYLKGEFFGDPFSGNFIQFTIKGSLKEVIFMISDGTGIWNGQYIGPAEGWLEAQEVLKSIKRG